MNRIILIAVAIFIISCSNSSKETSGLDRIKISEALENQREVNLSQFVESIEYIQLEETDQTVLFYPIIEVTDEFIIARNSGPSALGPILLFDRESGNFIRGVGKSGRGPGEFQMGNPRLYNIFSKTLYGLAYSHNEIQEYDTDGNFLGTIKLPIMIDEKVPAEWGVPSIHLNQYLDNEVFVSCIFNTTGWDKRKIILFTRDSIIKIFPNYLFWERKNWRSMNSIGNNPSFFRWKDKLSVKEEFNDTVFQITKSSLNPRYVFQTDGFGPPPELQDIGVGVNIDEYAKYYHDELAKYYFIKDICENDLYLFFQIEYEKKKYTGFYNKTDKTTTICKLLENNISAFIDDINDFMPIRPQKITLNNEMILKLEAEDIVKWINNNPDKLLRIGKNMDWLKSVSPASNPVIVIAKLKKIIDN